MKYCLLIEPAYRTKYPNLALCKISAKLKVEGAEVRYFKGNLPRTLWTARDDFDEIYITTLFTYDSAEALGCVKHYHNVFPQAKIIVGGVFASLMPELVERETGIKPFIGWSKELDLLRPDYDLIRNGDKWDNFSFIFTTRGCVNKCPFCAVPRLEPELWINPRWRDVVDPRFSNIMVSDNNLTAMPIEHFEEVCGFIREQGLRVVFDNGFDCRLFTDRHLEAIKGLRWVTNGLHFAFDGMEQDGHIQRVLERCIKADLRCGKVTVFTLFNFTDTPQEAEYRFREIIAAGGRPYPQRYTPLNQLSRRPIYVGKYWTKELAHEFRNFYLMAGYYTKMTFPERLRQLGRFDLLERFEGGSGFTRRGGSTSRS